MNLVLVRERTNRHLTIPCVTSDTFELLHSRSHFHPCTSSFALADEHESTGTGRSRVGPLQTSTTAPSGATSGWHTQGHDLHPKGRIRHRQIHGRQRSDAGSHRAKAELRATSASPQHQHVPGPARSPHGTARLAQTLQLRTTIRLRAVGSGANRRSCPALIVADSVPHAGSILVRRRAREAE